MNSATVAFRVDPLLKKSASEVAQSFGLDLASTMRMVMKKMSLERTIPVDVTKPAKFKPLTGQAYLKRLNESIEAAERGEYTRHDLIEV